MGAGEEENTLKRIAATLGEMLTWVRVTSYPTVAQIVRKEFGGEDPEAALRAQVYALSSDGRSSREISRLLGGRPAYRTIGALQQKWRRMGLAALVNPSSQRSPTRALFDLSDLGIDVTLPASAEAACGAVEGNEETEGTP